MKNYVQCGTALDLAAPYAVSSGGGMKVGAIIAIAAMDAASAALVAGYTKGVFDVTSDTGAAWAVGDVIYWDDAAKKFTKTTTSNTKCGIAVAAKLSADVVGRVSLVPSI